ncbi:MAG: lactate racemase domain-containing protein [Isosphaeraceae bacterium]
MASRGDDFPTIARVHQGCSVPHLDDVAGTVRRRILGSRLRERVPAGGRIAVGVGSRGIHCIAEVARAAVDALKEMGFRPFIVAAMGSHGGATAEGQRHLLAHYGITPEAMGVEIRTEMDTVVIGNSPIGLPIYFDRNAHGADGIVLLNRVKPHTDFRARHESGILKMLVIGLGKRDGAEQIHRLGLRGMQEVLPAVGRILLEKTKFALGLAILENARDLPSEIIPVDPDTILDVEPELLEKARSIMGRLPFDAIDVLIVGELGKNYSGAGMDPNVIGRLMVETQPDFERPKVTRLGVLDMSEESEGNIVGVGFADLTTERLVSQLVPGPFRINVLTSCFLERARIPITLPTDREVFRVALETCWRLRPEDVRLVIIPNTLELEEMWVSPAMAAEVEAHPDLTFGGDFGPIPFDDGGMLEQERLFPASVRGRRKSGSAYAHAH